MSSPTRDQTKLPITELIWPLLVENVLRTSLMSIDTLMLSHYSEKAVAAMSLVHQFAFFVLLVYMMVSVGASILIAQNLGAGRRRAAGLVGAGSLALTVGLALTLSALVYFLAGPVIALFRVEPEVAHYAEQFLRIYGGLSVFMALNIAQSSIVRVWGYPRAPMWVNIGCLLLTVGGNALCLFGPFGFPVLGIAGVAGSTVLSQVVACVVFHRIIKRRKSIQLPLRELRRIPPSVYRSVLAVGIPTVGENLSYNVSQIAILSMIARMGTTALATYGILISLLRYVFIPGASIGSGAQLKVGYLVGAGRHDEATHRVYRYFGIGFLISLVLVILLAFFRQPILALFTQDRRLLSLAGSVLLVAIVHEPGRNFNTIIIPALKGAGDIRFPVYVGIVSMWGLSVFGSWVLGLKLGLGLIGVWIAMTSDEWMRGLAMLLRWRSGAWKSRTLVDLSELAAAGPVWERSTALASSTTCPCPSPTLLPVAEE
jgi:putative MATE family efflux protein